RRIIGDMNGSLAAWGPSLLICLTLVLGILYNNSRLSDLRSYMDARFNAVDKRFDDLKDFIKSEVRRLEDRQSPIHRA
ncbi:MAG TPA: hypothetical protein VKJ01_03425, partial [Candidatus Solibacter sp.]|nr:hypothetical protein [Candidatus Solibacter sp.]